MSEFFGKRSLPEDPHEAVLELGRRVDELEQAIYVLLGTGVASPEFVLADNDAGFGPLLKLFRDSASPATNDLLAKVVFEGRDGSGDRIEYASLNATINDVSDVNGQLDIIIRIDDSLENVFRCDNAAGIPRAGAYWEDDTASEGPYLTARRRKTLMAADDKIGAFTFDGSNDQGPNNTLNYAKFLCRVLDPTDGSEDAQIEFSVIVGGVITGILSMRGDRDLTLLRSGVRITGGTGSPEGVLSAPIGSIYLRSDGGAGTSFYVKQSGTGNTGWAAK